VGDAQDASRAGDEALSAPNRFVIEDLVGLGLVAMDDGVPLITRNGRRALIRGSFRLWDLAA
jgi:hypothetical protein